MNAECYLGIDVSKGYSDFVLLGKEKQVLEAPFRLQDDANGRKQLRELIGLWFDQGMKALYCGVESTGGYENNWYNFLRGISPSLNIRVARLNAKGVKAVSDAALKRTITDAVSAENIAVYLMGFAEKVHYVQAVHEGEHFYKEGRQQFTFIRMLIKQKVQLNNQLEKLLYQFFPEMLVYCRNGVPMWLLRMLSRYSSAKAVIRAGERKLAGIAGISAAKAASLMVKSSQSNQEVSDRSTHVISQTCKEILHKEAMILEEKQYVTGIYKDDPMVKILTTIQGIGVETAIILALEIEDIKRFETSKKLAAYFGVHPTYKQSGDGNWTVGMSKKGRGDVRAALYMASLAGVRFNPIIKAMYARFRAKGMKHYQVMGVVMHKLLRIVFGILKTNKDFDPAVDQKNLERAIEKQDAIKEETKKKKKEKQEKINRFQHPTTTAPMSRIAAQKIKQVASQAS